jgi:hypothetical protein
MFEEYFNIWLEKVICAVLVFEGLFYFFSFFFKFIQNITINGKQTVGKTLGFNFLNKKKCMIFILLFCICLCVFIMANLVICILTHEKTRFLLYITDFNFDYYANIDYHWSAFKLSYKGILNKQI